jgi:hypothetical protein
MVRSPPFGNHDSMLKPRRVTISRRLEAADPRETTRARKRRYVFYIISAMMAIEIPPY